MSTGTLFPNIDPPRAPKSTKERFLRQLQARILRYTLTHEVTHADQIVSGDEIPEGVHPNVIGLAFSGLSDAGLIEAVGFRRSSRAARHRGISRLWRNVDVKTSRAYLKALIATGDDHVSATRRNPNTVGVNIDAGG